MELIGRLIFLPVALVLLVCGVYLACIVEDAPLTKLKRIFTDSPRCLICNSTATRVVEYGEGNFAKRGIMILGADHYFCDRHDPPETLWTTLWPEVDKYIAIIASLVMIGSGFLLSGRAAFEALVEGASPSAFLAAIAYAVGYFMNNGLMYIH